MGICNIKLISLVLALLVSINLIFALGVSSPYWKDNPLEMVPGETRDVSFSLVNRADAETATAYVVIDDSAGIASLKSGDIYTVAPGSTDNKVILEISIPEDAQIGETYNVKFSVSSAPEGEGTVQLSLKYGVDFPVKVVTESNTPVLDNNEKSSNVMIVIILIILVLVILVVAFLLMKNK